MRESLTTRPIPEALLCRGPGAKFPAQDRVIGDEGIERADTFWAHQLREEFIGDAGYDFGSKSRDAVLVGHRTAGLAHRPLIESQSWGRIGDHFNADAFLFQLLGNLRRLLDHRAVGDDRDVGALLGYAGFCQRTI